jgi:HAD superfamily hydrolase (TIGR01549 family)
MPANPAVPDLQTVSTFIFDLDGTLLHARPRTVDLLNRRVSEIWPTIATERLRDGERWWHYYWMPSEEMKRDVETHGSSTSSGFWQNYLGHYFNRLGIDPAEWAAHLPLTQALALANRPQEHLDTGAAALLRTLKDQGYRLALFTNRFRPVHETLAALDIDAFFDLVICGGELGAWKPDPHAFAAVLEKLECQPSETVYIGDNYYSDILGAQAAGLQTIMVDPKGLFPEADCPVVAHVGEIQAWEQ